jgi:hypothetical protein
MIMGIKLLIDMPTNVGIMLHKVSDLSDLWVKRGPFRNGATLIGACTPLQVAQFVEHNGDAEAVHHLKRSIFGRKGEKMGCAPVGSKYPNTLFSQHLWSRP